ncbi:MAG TPA: transferrin-binding protein-like solute binding protein [Burkholderiales bacterium]|nr:transferrin-binding protein-like solute binding protein [Burkholderiales bacterium]
MRNRKRRWRVLAAAMACAALGACGGGGDSGGAVRPVAFTSFSAVVPGQPVVAGGDSQTAFIVQVSGGTVTSSSPNLVNTTSTSAKLTYGAGSPPVLTGLEINTPQSGLGFSDGRGTQTVACDTDNCLAKGDGARVVLVNALGSANWNYQTFGYWLADVGGTANVTGALSVGNPTAGGSIPAGGTATYSGRSGGLYVSSGGILNEQTAAMTANVNFGTQSIAFSTTGTAIRPWGSTGTATLAPQLDMTGTLAYTSGVNRFTGNVSSTLLNGTASGRFYGPAAEEIGGTYQLTNGPVESMIGAFGGKK